MFMNARALGEPMPPLPGPGAAHSRDVLRSATIEGAKDLKLDNKTGSLTPARRPTSSSSTRSDQRGALNVVPGAVVSLMDRSNVETVNRRGQGAQVEREAAGRRSA